LLKTTQVTSTENPHHQELVGFIWSIADKLRGLYRPPQYRRVMLPLIVLRRLDTVLEPTKKAVLDAKVKDEALEKAIAKVAMGSHTSGGRQQSLYNLSEFTFQKLLGDGEGIASNLTAYIR